MKQNKELTSREFVDRVEAELAEIDEINYAIARLRKLANITLLRSRKLKGAVRRQRIAGAIAELDQIRRLLKPLAGKAAAPKPRLGNRRLQPKKHKGFGDAVTAAARSKDGKAVWDVGGE